MSEETQRKPFALVVDDDVSLGKIFGEVLNMVGFDVEVLHDARQTLTKMSARMPTLVSLDMQMPHVSGVEVLHQIRADERFAQVKVIMVTANGRVSDEEGVADLADLILIKPVTFDQIKNFAMRLTK